MRAFLTLCLIAVAASEKLGYNYSPNSAQVGGSAIGSGIGSSIGSGIGSGIGNGIGSGIGSGIGGGYNSGVSYHSGSGFGGALSSASLSSGGSYNNGGSYSSDSGFASGGLSSAGGIGSGSFSSGGGFSSGGVSSNSYSSNSYAAPAPAQVITELNKEYFFHTAPEEVQDASNNQSPQSILKKNLRVVFIKAPENNGFANAALQVVKQATEDQTAIYVLTKQADVSDITQQLQQVSEVHSKKPEVHFVKYRTQEDAINAQRTIQAQYDALGGSSKSSNEVVAPVLNYASSSPVVSNYQGSGSQASGSYSSGGSLSASGSYSTGGSLSSSGQTNSYSAPSGTGSFSGPSASYLAPKSSYLPPVAL